MNPWPAYNAVTAFDQWRFRSLTPIEVAMSLFEAKPLPAVGETHPAPDTNEVRYPYRPDWMKAADGPESGAASEESEEPVAPPQDVLSKEDEDDAADSYIEYDLREFDITTEQWREYEYGGQTYRIDLPQKLSHHEGGTTHRVTTVDGVCHIMPVPGAHGCVLRCLNKDPSNPCEF